jgi:hypothetical protein
MWSISALSNQFNVMAWLHPLLKNYHFGWRSDILSNIGNNYNQGNSVGTLFPSVLFEVPENVETNYLDNNTNVNCTLYFDNLQYRNNLAAGTTATLAEQWYELEIIVHQFLKEFGRIGKELIKQGRGITILQNSYQFTPYSDIGQDGLVTIQVKFTVQYKTFCPTWNPDYSTLPPQMPFPTTAEDYEDWNHFTDTNSIIP